MMWETETLSPISSKEIVDMSKSAAGCIKEIIFHWTAGHYGQMYSDYHLGIDKDGRFYASTDNLTDKKNHCWHRNTATVGIALLCCAPPINANDGENADLGEEPPTEAQIESLAKVVQIICDYAGLPITYDFAKSHCEAALEDGYGPYSGDPETRWDLWFLPDNAQENAMVPGGQLIRDKAAWYHKNSI